MSFEPESNGFKEQKPVLLAAMNADRVQPEK